MAKTWTSGSEELLAHAAAHMQKDTAFDKRMAFISIDNAVEITIKTYLRLPKQFFGHPMPTKKEIDESFNSFTAYLSLLFKYTDKILVGIDPGDIEHYHRIRNTLYHEGTGLAVDQEYINAYYTIASLLLKRLFNVAIETHGEKISLENVILNWNRIEELLIELTDLSKFEAGTYKWEVAISKGILPIDVIKHVTDLRLLRNEIAHSNTIDANLLKIAVDKSQFVLQTMQNILARSQEYLRSKNFFYEPNVSEITGVLTFESFYGPPNYGETPDKDQIEMAWILNLSRPINVYQEMAKLEEGDHNITKYNIERVQLNAYKHKIDLSNFKDQKMTIKGSFWGSFTGHHRTPVLMTVINAKLYNPST